MPKYSTPHAVHVHARGQRITVRNDPVCKVQAVSTPAARLQLAEEAGNRRFHDLAGIVHPVAAGENARHLRRHRDSRYHAGNL